MRGKPGAAQNTAQLWAQRRPRFLQASPPRLTSCFCNECWGGKHLKGGEPRSHASPGAPWCKAQGGNLERSPSHSTKQPTPGRSALLLLLAALVPQAQQWGRGGQSPALPSPPGAPRLTWRYPRPKDPRTPFTPPQSAPGCCQHCWSAHLHLHSHPKPFIQLLLRSLLAPISLLWGSDALTTHTAPGTATVR